MKRNPIKLSINNQLIFTLIFVFAVVFYLFNIGFSDLWSDEAYTKSMISGSYPEFFNKFKNDLHPPLYYLGLKLFSSVFGSGTLHLRLFSVLGVISTLLLGYVAGRRVFGEKGAIYFCLLLISIPMIASQSHSARMYTWAAFSVTGVFIYSYLFMKSGKNRDLIFLFVFTLMAIYTHYYSMAAAFAANLFVLIYLLRNKNKKWIHHLATLFLATILFLPWLTMFILQIKKVQHAFWVQDVNFNSLLSCFTIPFTEQYWTTGYSVALTILIYCLIIFVVFKSFFKSFKEYRLILWLALSIFLGTLLIATIISLISQPILYSRYVIAISTMLIVPVTILFITIKAKLLKITLLGLILFLGIKVAVSTYYFSYGPYKQTMEYIASNYPEIHKVLHISEITAGPMVEYTGNTGINHYWLKAEMSNVDAFTEIKQFEKPNEFLYAGEEFCAVQFNDLYLNEENLDLVISQSELIKIDTVSDNKVNDGNIIQVYVLKYDGK